MHLKIKGFLFPLFSSSLENVIKGNDATVHNENRKKTSTIPFSFSRVANEILKISKEISSPRVTCAHHISPMCIGIVLELQCLCVVQDTYELGSKTFYRIT